MSEFAIDKWYSQTAKLQGVIHVDAVLEEMYLRVRYSTHKYFKAKQEKPD